VRGRSVNDPYRVNDVPAVEVPTRVPFLCRHGWHKIRRTRTLYGGEGPDEAAYEVECKRCGATGWEYCDGWVKVSR